VLTLVRDHRDLSLVALAELGWRQAGDSCGLDRTAESQAIIDAFRQV
jgi:hypothetical protein